MYPNILEKVEKWQQVYIKTKHKKSRIDPIAIRLTHERTQMSSLYILLVKGRAPAIQETKRYIYNVS